MALMEDLTEDERYLWAILSDPSGLDQAEFFWYDAESEEDGCFRAWPYQWKWWRNDSPLQIDQAGRSVGKSMSILVRAFAFPFLHPGQSMLLTAPEGVHLSAITNLVEAKLNSTRIGMEMRPSGGSGGITKRPFLVKFRNDAQILGRIPQRDGRGVKGMHPLWLEMDEAQDYPDPGWTEIIETLKRGSKGAMWRAHGVTKGMRDYFYKFTQPESGWTVHRVTAMERPNWTDQERQEKIEAYGSRHHPDYRRNVLGLHGDASNPLFVLHRLMACFDDNDESEYNQDIYQYLRINDEMVQDFDGDVLSVLDLPMTHRSYKKTWIGMDVGYTNHPSEILVFAEESKSKKKSDETEPESSLRLISRIHLERIAHHDQVAVMLWLLDFYQPQAFAMDKTGLGLPLFQDVQERARNDKNIAKLAERIKGYNFSSKIIVDIDDSVEVDEWTGDDVRDAGVVKNVLEQSSDRLRDLVDKGRITFPWDTELIGEFQGQTWSYDKSKMDLYGRKKLYSKGQFHALDAARMAVLAFAQKRIDAFVKKEKFEPTPVIFL